MSNETSLAKANLSPVEMLVKLMQDAAQQKDSQSTAGVKIEHEGTKIKLPALPKPMPPAEAAMHLQRLADMEEQYVAIVEEIDAFPPDGAVALMKAMQQKFGWAETRPTPGFFGSRPPQTITIETSLTEKATVVWGRFVLPGFSEKSFLDCGARMDDDGRLIFDVSGQVKQKERYLVAELAELTRSIVRKESIYRGKAMRVRHDADGNFDASKAPAFINISQRDPLILPQVVENAVRANIFTPVEKSDACRRAGIPLKRGIVLAGPPGTGKTLTAQELARKCVANGWTYILLPNLNALPHVMQFAVRYSPCVVFCEDIDMGTSGERDERMNELLNVMDGVNTKTTEIMLVFTTNNHRQIERTLVRPGRIDAIIEFPKPHDGFTISRFIRHYGGKCVAADEDLQKSCLALEGAIPAVIREAVERAKLYALSRDGTNPDNIVITDIDIFTAAETMKNHIDFLDSKREKVKSKAETLGEAFIDAVGNAARDVATAKLVKNVDENVKKMI